jgi:putative ABC transport system permease protein
MIERGNSLRRVFRSLYRNPGYTIATVLVLGIGVGAVSLMFSTFNTVVLQPLPYPRPDRLMWLSSLTPAGNQNSTSYDDYRDFRDGAQAFQSLAAYMLFSQAQILTGGGEAERVNSYRVTANLFPTLGVAPELGRGFRPDEEQTGQDQVAILSQAFWQRRYGGDPAAVGSRLILDGRSVQIVGVMPPGFDFPAGADLWLPIQQAAGYAAGRGNNNFLVLGRLGDGASLEQAQAQLDVVARNIADAYPNAKKGWGIQAVSLHERLFGAARSSILTLMALISLVPLVACANVASLTLARALSRRSEFAARLALGASRGRLIGQLATESLVVALAGGAVGLALAYQGGGLLRALAPAALPRLSDIRVDGTVMAFTLVVSLLLVPLFAVIPALRGTDIGIADALKAGGGRVISGRRSGVRSVLVVAQVTLSVILLFGSGLLLQSFLRLQRVNLGFTPDNLLSFQVQLPSYKYQSPDGVQRAWDEVTLQLGTLPGVRAVGGVDQLPFRGRGPWNEVWAQGKPPASLADANAATRRFATEGFFAAMGIALRAGRVFTPDDGRSQRLVTIINEKLARQFFPGEDPVGRFLMLPWRDPPLALEIVGVAGDISELGAGVDPTPTFYLPAALSSPNTLNLLVRTTGDPLALAGAVRRTLREMDPDMPMSQVTTMSARVTSTLVQPRFRAAVVAIFALVSLILSAIGLYGVLAYFVQQHSHDIGIRLALGATSGTIRQLVVARGMVLVAWGCGMGMAAGLLGARVIASQGWLFGVGTMDPTTLAAVVVFLALVALVACLVPAYRAARVNPVEAMQAE